MADEFDVLVVGDGVTGLCAAASFARSCNKVGLLRTVTNPSLVSSAYDVRNFAINRASERLLHKLGAWQRLAQDRLGWFDSIGVWDADSKVEIEFPRPLIDAGPMASVIEQANLHRALSECVDSSAVVRVDGKPRTLRSGTPATLGLDNGRILTAALLIAADGANSWVRQAADIGFNRRRYNQRAIVANVRCEHRHRRRARQVFLASGPLAFLPMAESDLCSIVWSCDEPLANDLAALDDLAFAHRLRTAFDNRLGALELESPRVEFSLEHASVPAWYRDSVVLVGDAAHLVHPLAGQGLNLGLMDVGALYDCVGAPRAQLQWPRSADLARYQRWRKSESAALGGLTDGLQRLFAEQRAGLVGLRKFGMALTNQLPAVRNGLAAIATGTRGDLPSDAERS